MEGRKTGVAGVDIPQVPGMLELKLGNGGGVKEWG